MEQAVVRLVWCPTDENAADIFTKSLGTRRFKCRSALIEQRPDSLVLRLSASPGSAAGRPTVGGGSSASTAWFG